MNFTLKPNLSYLFFLLDCALVFTIVILIVYENEWIRSSGQVFFVALKNYTVNF